MPAQPGWVGLYSDQMVEWGENANRLDALCASIADGLRQATCRTEKLQTRPFIADLWKAPSKSAEQVGTLLLLATPGQGITAYFVRKGSTEPRHFQPDLNMQDGATFFHQTYLDRRGDWFLLPEDPFPSGTWFNARDLGEAPHVLAATGIVETAQGNLVILGVDGDSVRVRPEQPADMWCKRGQPPPLTPGAERRIPKRELYTSTGHLGIRPAYMKGC